MENKTELNIFLITVGELFDKEISKTLIKIYWEALKPYTDKEVKSAFEKVICNCRFFPKPADIIEYIPKQLGVITSLEAWVIALKWFEGGTQPIDAVINKAVNILGGYEKVSRTPYPQLPWLQKDFEKLYNDLTERGDTYGLLEMTKPLEIT